MDEKVLRDYLRRFLSWHEAHVDWKAALKDFPAKQRGTRPPGAPHSAWELLEHMRIATVGYSRVLPRRKARVAGLALGLLAEKPAPPNAAAWDKSVKAFEQDLEAMGKLVADPKTDLFAPIPHGSGQTDSARSAADRRPQCVSSGAVRPGTAAAGLLAGNLDAQFAPSRALRHLMMMECCAHIQEPWR